MLYLELCVSETQRKFLLSKNGELWCEIDNPKVEGWLSFSLFLKEERRDYIQNTKTNLNPILILKTYIGNRKLFGDCLLFSNRTLNLKEELAIR